MCFCSLRSILFFIQNIPKNFDFNFVLSKHKNIWTVFEFLAVSIERCDYEQYLCLLTENVAYLFWWHHFTSCILTAPRKDLHIQTLSRQQKMVRRTFQSKCEKLLYRNNDIKIKNKVSKSNFLKFCNIKSIIYISKFLKDILAI